MINEALCNWDEPVGLDPTLTLPVYDAMVTELTGGYHEFPRPPLAVRPPGEPIPRPRTSFEEPFSPQALGAGGLAVGETVNLLNRGPEAWAAVLQRLKSEVTVGPTIG